MGAESTAGSAGGARGDGSFVRGLRVLASVTDNGAARAGEIADETGLPLSTVYRYLRTLRDFALIEEYGGSYVPGWRLSEISRHDVSRTRLLELGYSFLSEITELTGETSVLTVRVGTNAICLRQVESKHEDRTAFGLDQLLPLYAGTGQRVLLAHAPQSVIDHVLSERLQQLTGRTLSAPILEHELVRIREEGWAVSRGELTEHSLAVAVPVFSSGREVVCSLATAGLEHRCVPAWVSSAKQILTDRAERLSAMLGGGR